MNRGAMLKEDELAESEVLKRLVAKNRGRDRGPGSTLRRSTRVIVEASEFRCLQTRLANRDHLLR